MRAARRPLRWFPLAFLAAALLLACPRKRPETEIVAEKLAPSASASASTSTSPKSPKNPKNEADPLAPTSASEALCAKLVAESAAAKTAALARTPTLLGELVPDAIGTCLPYGHGAWAIVLEDLSDAPEEAYGGPDAKGGIHVKWSLVHVDLSGARASARPTYVVGEARDVAPSGENLTTGDIHRYDLVAQLADVDADGVAEVYLRFDVDLYEGPGSSRGRIWALGGASVRPYPPAASLDVESLVDFDHDGRTDLVTYSGEKADVMVAMNQLSVHGLPLLAHARPDGTFAVGDATARAYAALACPKAPTKLLAARVDDPTTFVNVSCARAFGLGAPAVKAMLTKELAPAAPDEDLTKWADRPPIVTLP